MEDHGSRVYPADERPAHERMTEAERLVDETLARARAQHRDLTNDELRDIHRWRDVYEAARSERSTESPTGDGIVQIAYLHGEHVSHSWHDSMRRVMDYDQNATMVSHSGERCIAEKPLNIKCGSGVLLPPLRNYATRLFLDGTEHEWLLFVDTDMGFAADAVHRLLESADPIERPIMGALCFAVMTAGYDGMGGWRQVIVPTMYKIGNVEQTGKPSFCHYGPYESGAVLRVAGTGAAFLLIHRSVLNLMREKHGDHWWDLATDHVGDTIGEDIMLCLRALALQVPIHVNTAVKTTHHKATWVSEDDYLAVNGVTPAELDTYPDLPVFVDLPASFAALERNEHDHDGMLKLRPDLDRYRKIIEETKPDVIIETGTFRGASARWFARQGLDVITIDIRPPKDLDPRNDLDSKNESVIWPIKGDSADPTIVQLVSDLLERWYPGGRVMVVLDSDHSAGHVTKEIEAYGPLVTPGCHLVIEDTIFGYGTSGLRDQHFPGGLDGSPLDAVVTRLVSDPSWSRDVAIERLSPVSCAPAGWWVRNG
jgi:cephalosporin hydroxylase